MNLTERAKKQSQAIYLACDEKIADDISSTITKLLNALEIANEALKYCSVIHMPMRAVAGKDFAEYALEHNCDHAEEAQSKIKLLLEGEA